MDNNGKWADTTPIAIFVVAGILIGAFWPMMIGLVTPAASPLIGAITLGSAIVFVILMVIEIRGGNLFGATLNGVFGVLLGLVPALVFLTEFAAAGMGVAVDPRVVGWYFMFVGVVMLIVGFAAGTIFWHMAIALWALSLVLFMTGMVFAGIGHPAWLSVLGWVLFGGGLYFIYVASAAFLGGMFQRPVLPLGKPLFKAH
jgi:hypothetical protein